MRNKKLAIISAALLSAATFHVYQTSHAAPLTIGHFFMMLSIYFFIKLINNKKYIFPLLITTILLILSHHFTTYFYLISITFILFSIISDNYKNKNDLVLLSYVLTASLFTFSYWALIAKPVFYNFIQGKMFFSPFLIIILFYMLLFIGYLLIKKIKQLKVELSNIKYLNGISNIKKFIFIYLILLTISLYATTIFIPGVYVKLTFISIIFSLPMIFIVSLSLTGVSELKKTNGGQIIKGWIFAISLSFIYSLMSSNFYPDRHLEYIIIPLCVPAAIIIKNIFSINRKKYISKPQFSPIFKSLLKQNHLKTIIAGFISIMCISNMIAAYPTIDSLNHIDERVTKPCINVMDWMDGKIKNNSIIASDHRLEMLLWAEGFNITYGNTNKTWISNNITDCFSELFQLNVDYILIDDIMKNNVVNVDMGYYYHMTNKSYEKFGIKPFNLIFRNATYTDNGVELHWIELYKINYNFINNRL
jgi:hypothetical protein